MIAALSLLGLGALWALLANLERLPWPPQRHSAIHDQTYWSAVQRDTAAYLSTHTRVNASIRRSVEGLNAAATQKLGGFAR